VTSEGSAQAHDWLDDAGSGTPESPAFDTSVAHIARVYDYRLGGKDNYAADRAAGDAALQAYPDLASSVRANRAFLARVVRYLELVPPGVVRIQEWRPDAELEAKRPAAMWGGIGYKR
jgi:hypothetical protein